MLCSAPHSGKVGAEECPPQLLLHTQRNNRKKTLVKEPVNKNMHNYAPFKFYNIAKKMCYIPVISYFPFVVVITVLSEYQERLGTLLYIHRSSKQIHRAGMALLILKMRNPGLESR